MELKAAHPDRVLLYRLGDFFECFFEDAIELSRVLPPGTVLEEGMLSARRNNWPEEVVVELAQQEASELIWAAAHDAGQAAGVPKPVVQRAQQVLAQLAA